MITNSRLDSFRNTLLLHQAKRFDDKAVQLAAREQEVRILKDSLVHHSQHRTHAQPNNGSSPNGSLDSNLQYHNNSAVSVQPTPNHTSTSLSGPLNTFSVGDSRPLEASWSRPAHPPRAGGPGGNGGSRQGPKRFMTPSQRRALSSSTPGNAFAYSYGHSQVRFAHVLKSLVSPWGRTNSSASVSDICCVLSSFL